MKLIDARKIIRALESMEKSDAFSEPEKAIIRKIHAELISAPYIEYKGGEK